jgi:hypothetical protein
MTAKSSEAMYDDGSTRTSFAYGVTLFGGVMLTTVAVFQILGGIGALAKDTIFVEGVNYAYEIDLTTWGWIHLVIGVIALATGIGIVMAQTWAYMLGIMIAVLSAVANFAFIPHYPVWSIIVIAFDGLVIWALCSRIMSGNEDL